MPASSAAVESLVGFFVHPGGGASLNLLSRGEIIVTGSVQIWPQFQVAGPPGRPGSALDASLLTAPGNALDAFLRTGAWTSQLSSDFALARAGQQAVIWTRLCLPAPGSPASSDLDAFACWRHVQITVCWPDQAASEQRLNHEQ